MQSASQLLPDSKAKSIVLALAALGVLYVIFTLSLQLACWFALVETTFQRCALLTLALGIPTIAAWVLTIALFMNVRTHADIRAGNLIFLPLIWGGSMLACGYWTRRMLECRWRSVVTILVMFNFSAQLIAGLALLMAAGITLGFALLLP